MRCLPSQVEIQEDFRTQEDAFNRISNKEQNAHMDEERGTWYLYMYIYTYLYIPSQIILSYYSCKFLRCSTWAFNRFDLTTQKNVGAIPHSDGANSCTYCKIAHNSLNIALMQSNMVSFYEDLEKLF